MTEASGISLAGAVVLTMFVSVLGTLGVGGVAVGLLNFAQKKVWRGESGSVLEALGVTGAAVNLVNFVRSRIRREDPEVERNTEEDSPRNEAES